MGTWGLAPPLGVVGGGSIEGPEVSSVEGMEEEGEGASDGSLSSD